MSVQTPNAPATSVHTTACPRNCYSTCALRVEVENGRLRRVMPHPGNRATDGGGCLKGLSYVERAHSPDRVLEPLRRRPDGTFEPFSWDDALDLIAEQLEHCRREWGPQSVFYYSASGTKGLLNAVGSTFFRLFGGYTTTYGDLCWPAGLEATRLTLGENKHNAPWDLENARLIVLWGKNPAETNLHQMPFIDRALERGARLVTIDPRRTQSAERAHLHVAPRPGSDGALALGVAHLLVREGQVDEDFIARHVLGFDEFAEALDEYPPERAAAICEIEEADVHRLAELFATTRPATIIAGYGMQRYTTSGQSLRAILALLALTGNLGQSGAGWQFANLQTSIFDEVPDPIAFYPPEEPDGVARIAVSTARLGRDMLELDDPPLAMAWVERGNPLTQNPDSNRVRQAFEKLRFRVVVDQFLTDTARIADVVLPAKTFLEQSDVIGAYWHPYLQLTPKVLEPPGQVKPESEIFRLLAERLGMEEDAIDAAFPVADAAVDAWLEKRLAPHGLDLELLRQGPLLVPGHEEIAFADCRFATPSGKIELYSDEAARRWGVDPLPLFAEPGESARSAASEAERFPLQLLTPNTKNRIHSQFNNLRMIRRISPRPTVEIHPADAAARGLADGDRARIFNERGEFTVEARLTEGIRRGAVAVSNGWWESDGGNVNVCSLGRETDMGHGAAFHDNLVEVEKTS